MSSEAGIQMDGADLRSLMLAYERRLIAEALEAYRGNQRRAAHALGLLPTTLNEKMKRFGLRPRDVPGDPEGTNEAA